ncbi:MAG: hypothetical protein ACFFB5_01605 [Promethearchaeota archaeon]
MVGLKISSEEIKEIIPILGLTDDDQGKIYLYLLSLGMATLGQISLLSGLDYIKTQEILQILVGSKLAKRIPGKVGRYIALEPFLKAFFLAYDPITLVNIHKEASSVFQVQLKQISEMFKEASNNFQKHTTRLENDFSQSLDPIKLNFNKLADNFRQIIESSEKNILNNIGELMNKTGLLVKQSKELNEEIIKVNLEKLKNIPSIFVHYTPKVEQELKLASQMINKDLKRLEADSKTNFELLKTNIQEGITVFKEEIGKILDQFETDRSEEQKNFEGKINQTGSLIESLRLNAIQKKSKFLEIKEGYNDINEMVRELFTQLDTRLNNIESLLKDSISDIQSRKLFKGKDEFISNLIQVDGDRKVIQQTIKDKLMILEKVNNLNNTLNETENIIVQATENGLNEVQKILDDEVQLLSRSMHDIKLKIGSEFRNSIQEYLNNSKNDIKGKIGNVETIFDQKITNFNQQLDEITAKFSNEISNLIQNISEEFEANLESYFEKDETFDVSISNLNKISEEIDKFGEKSSIESKSALNQITDIERTFSLFISGMNTFITSFAETQLEDFNSNLDKAEEILNTQVIKIEHQLEQEISALSFSIKEMKQKLNKLSELSRSVDISEVEPSLLSSDLAVGETAIIMILRDLTLRAKSSLTILMPRPEIQTLMVASKLPMKTRVNIIGDFRKVPESTLKKILSSANLRLKQLDTVDFWGCIRDAEELLVCPEPKHPEKEDLIGVITTNENLVELFSQEIMTYTTRSREIIL